MACQLKTPAVKPESVTVTFVSSHALHGGAELHLASVIDRLGSDWVASIVTLADGPLVGRLRGGGHSVEVVPTPARLGMLIAALKLRRVLRAQAPELVHADGVKAALVCALATVGTRIPILWFKVDYSRDGWLARLIAARCRLIGGISASVTEVFRGSQRERVRVVPCGIPDLPVDRAASRRLVLGLVQADGDAPVVAHLGRLHPRKGQLELIEAAPAVLAARPEVRFLLVPPPAETDSEREFEQRLRQRAQELGVAAEIFLSPRRGRSVEVMAGCELVAVPSVPDVVSGWREGFGLVGVEAMAVGTPVVGYADGALPETLGDCAVLVQTGDRTALGEAIVRILGDRALSQRLVRCGSSRAERYRLASTIGVLKECYREAVGPRKAD